MAFDKTRYDGGVLYLRHAAADRLLLVLQAYRLRQLPAGSACQRGARGSVPPLRGGEGPMSRLLQPDMVPVGGLRKKDGMEDKACRTSCLRG